MKIWKIVTVLLAVLLLAGCVGSVSGATVSTIAITGIDTPAAGVKPDTTASTSTTGVILGTISWSPSSTTFNAATNYTVTILVMNYTGYEFSSSPAATVNGKFATAVKSGNTVTVSYTFDKTAAASTTSAIELSLTKPLAANTPATTATISKPTSGLKVTSVTWSPNDSRFKMGTKYTATIVLESTNEKAYPISTAVTAKVNGYTAKVTSATAAKATVTYEFGETEPKGTAESFAFTIRAPVVGEKPVTSVSSNSQSDKTTTAVAWSTSSAFQPDMPYSVTITVNAKEGYVIKNGATATINGIAAPLIWESSTKATVTHTFAQIASVNTVNVNFDAPATGEIAKTAATSVTATPSGAANSATIKWAPALVNNEFEAGVEYTATVTIPISGANTVFDKETIVYINGEQAQTSVSSNYKTITATYTFPKTTFIPNPIEIIKEMFNLMLAIFNPASYVFL